MRNLLLVLGVYHLGLGLLMVVAPGTFFEEFATYGVQNDHYIRDNATINLAFGVALFVAAGRPAWRAPVLAVIGLQYAFHVINHAFDVSETDPDWQGPFALVSLALARGADRLALAAGGDRAMKVLVAGGTGAVGRPLVRQLEEAGHEVVAASRSSESAPMDALDAASVNEAVGAARPEVIVNQLTAIPDPIDPRKMEQQFEPTNRLRREGTANLMAAAREHGVRRVISQSIAFAYAPTGAGAWTEEDRLFTEAGEIVRAVEVARAADARSRRRRGRRAALRLLLRAGHHLRVRRRTAEAVRKRQFPIIGKGTGVFSFIHIDDAASATVAALERGAPGIYNVVDDDPAPLREYLPVLAEALGAKRPFRVPKFVGRLAAGPHGRPLRDDPAAGVEREGQARARLAAALAELAPGLPRGAGLGALGPEPARCHDLGRGLLGRRLDPLPSPPRAPARRRMRSMASSATAEGLLGQLADFLDQAAALVPQRGGLALEPLGALLRVGRELLRLAARPLEAPSACERERAVISAADSCACLRIALVSWPTSSRAFCTMPSRVWVFSSASTCARAPSGARRPAAVVAAQHDRETGRLLHGPEDIQASARRVQRDRHEDRRQEDHQHPDRHQHARLDHVADRRRSRSRARRSRRRPSARRGSRRPPEVPDPGR